MTTATATKTFTKAQALILHEKARAAGFAAGEAKVPAPMVVSQHANAFDDSSPVVKAYFVPQGMCGFAWVNFPGNTSFGRAMKAAGKATKAYGGGLQVWVREFGQSVEQKEAYAHAYAEVLREAGIKAYAGSRLD